MGTAASYVRRAPPVELPGACQRVWVLVCTMLPSHARWHHTTHRTRSNFPAILAHLLPDARVRQPEVVGAVHVVDERHDRIEQAIGKTMAAVHFLDSREADFFEKTSSGASEKLERWY